MGRDVLIGSKDDPLRLYEKHYNFTATCGRPHCEHARDIPVAMLLRRFPRDSTIGEISLHFRCSRCGFRGARLRANYIGPIGDGR
jgi:hypothetical protein